MCILTGHYEVGKIRKNKKKLIINATIMDIRKMQLHKIFIEIITNM